ncbi:putative glycosyl transferase [Candidatus Nanopelagicaceae bacterium]
MESKNLRPAVSVIVPVHGDAPHLISTIESIRMQSFEEYEAIIILDRASEEIENYVRNLAFDLENFRVVISKEPGISHALNIGIRESSGEFIARIDADDLMQKDRLALQKKFLEQHQEVVCVGSQVTKINVSGIRIGRSSYPGSDKQITSTLLFRNCIAHPSVMYRRSSILEVNGYRPEFDGVEDYDLWLRLSMIGQIRNMQKTLTSYRVWENQVTTQKRHLIFENAKRVRESFENSVVSPRLEARVGEYDWLVSADHFNKSLESFRYSGEKFSALKNLLNSFRITPSLTTRVCGGYLLNFVSARIRDIKREN